MTYYFPLKSNTRYSTGMVEYPRSLPRPFSDKSELRSLFLLAPRAAGTPGGSGISGRYLGNPYAQASEQPPRAHLTF